jgi:hypothetical protein
LDLVVLPDLEYLESLSHHQNLSGLLHQYYLARLGYPEYLEGLWLHQRRLHQLILVDQLLLLNLLDLEDLQDLEYLENL